MACAKRNHDTGQELTVTKYNLSTDYFVDLPKGKTLTKPIRDFAQLTGEMY